METFSGYAEGLIGKEPKGANGFGYDPVFYPKGHERTFAEMFDKEKDLLSHRGKAATWKASYDFLTKGVIRKINIIIFIFFLKKPRYLE